MENRSFKRRCPMAGSADGKPGFVSWPVARCVERFEAAAKTDNGCKDCQTLLNEAWLLLGG
jgi:hypothetical protein